MERSRRSQQSDDKRSTSLLIQQLAAARERKLQGHGTSRSRASDLLEDASDSDLLNSEQSFDEEHEDADSPAASHSTDTHASNVPQPRRSRLLRRDKQSSACTSASAGGGDVDELADLMQDFGLSASSGPTPQQQEYRFPSSRSTDGSQRSYKTSSNGNGARQGEAVTNANALEGSDPDGPAVAASRHKSKAAPATAADSSSEDDDDDDDDDSYPESIPRSRKPAAPAAPSKSNHDSSSMRNRSSNSTEDTAQDLQDDDGDDGDETNSSSADTRPRLSTTSNSSSSSNMGRGIRPYLDKQTATAAEPAEGSLVLEGGFCLDVKVASKLYPHQVQGVKWLWSLHTMRKGGILADDMGLGKTMQCSGFLAGSLRSNQAVRALVVAPKTLLAHWEKELRVCGMSARTHSFYGSSEGERAAALRTITGRGGVMLTTYGMVLHNAGQLRMGLGPAARDADEHEDEFDLLCPDPPPGRRILWDYIILDEGHKIKNSRTQLAQRLRELRAISRVIISGTPVQNNLSELHSLMDFAVPGLLGGAKEFKLVYEKAITAGQDRDATLRVRELGAAKAAELRKIVAPFMLRREKKEVLGSGSSGKDSIAATERSTSSGSTAGGNSGAAVVAAAAASSSGAAGPAPMGTKHDLVVWLRLQPLQRHIYEAFLHSDAVREALNSTRSPLAALTVLKKVCDHPALLSERATNLVLSAATKPHKKPPKVLKQRRNSLDDFIVDDGSDDNTSHSGSSSEQYDSDAASDSDGSSSWHAGNNSSKLFGKGTKAHNSRAAVAAELDDAGFSDEFISWAESEGLESRLLSDVDKRGTEASCKSLFVTALLDQLVAAGHRTLVFSQSRVMLDILQAAVVARGWPFCRIDGSMSSTDARQAEVDKFQAPGAKIPVFLLTTQVGGLGLTLTAANRVVIVDPSWNPATDNQSVDRAYRIGQSRNVIVYRLVTCGTVEEKIYRKQVFKGGLSKAGMEEGVQLRYFTHQELHELFAWDPEALVTSETQQLLAQQHSQHTRKTLEQDRDLANHVSWVESSPLCAGTSEHGLLFSELDPEAKTLQLQRPEYNTNNVTAHALAERGQRAGRGLGGRGSKGLASGVGFNSAAGPSAAEISTMLSSLNIAGSSSSRGEDSKSGAGASLSAAAAVAAKGKGGLGGAAAAAAERQQCESRVKEVEVQLRKVTADVNGFAARLPDGGVKLKARQAELQAALAAAQAQLQQVLPQKQQQPAAAEGSTAAAGSDRQHALVDITNGPPAGGGVPAADGQATGQQQHHRTTQEVMQLPPPPPRSTPQQYVQLPQPPPQAQQQPVQQLVSQQRSLPPSMQQQRPQYSQPTQQQHQQWYGRQPPPPPRRPHQQQQQQHGLQQQQGLGPTLLQQGQPGNRSAASVSVGGSSGGGGAACYADSRHPLAGNSSSSSGSKPISSSSRTPSAAAASSARSADPLPHSLKAETLDGRVPTMAELQKRKHVLKRALQQEDKAKEQAKAGGQQYPVQRQQQWAAMYQEYKEIKRLLEQAEQLQAAGAAGALGKQQQSAVETIDLT